MEINKLCEEHYYKHENILENNTKTLENHEKMLESLRELPQLMDQLNKELAKLSESYINMDRKYLSKDIFELEKELRNQRLNSMDRVLSEVLEAQKIISDRMDKAINKVLALAVTTAGTVIVMYWKSLHP